jgi:hypothetical protein
MAQQNDIGTRITVTVTEGGSAMNISTATTKNINLLSPGGTTSENTALFTTDGSEGKIYYVTVTDDIDEEGPWKIQAHIITPSKNFKTKWGTFTVGANIVVP